MDLGLTGRAALVTGGSKGIGLAIAEELVLEGCKVMICGRGQDQLETAAARLAEKGTAEWVAADVRSRAEIEAAVTATIERFGSIEVLVNNAGGTTNFGGYDDLDDDDWIEAFELNLMSAVHASRAAIPTMRERGWGRIVNVASESAMQPDSFFPHYASQKAAMLSVTKSLSKALAGSGVLVNAVSPAFVKTPIVEDMLAQASAKEGIDVEEAERRFLHEERPNITVGRAGRPEEIGRIVTVLCSDAASYVNGTNVRVDAGSVTTIG